MKKNLLHILTALFLIGFFANPLSGQTPDTIRTSDGNGADAQIAVIHGNFKAFHKSGGADPAISMNFKKRNGMIPILRFDLTDLSVANDDINYGKLELTIESVVGGTLPAPELVLAGVNDGYAGGKDELNSDEGYWDEFAELNWNEGDLPSFGGNSDPTVIAGDNAPGINDSTWLEINGSDSTFHFINYDNAQYLDSVVYDTSWVAGDVITFDLNQQTLDFIKADQNDAVTFYIVLNSTNFNRWTTPYMKTFIHSKENTTGVQLAPRLVLSETNLTPTYAVTFTVTDSDGGAAIEGATVEVNGESGTTNSSGEVSFNLEDGEYTYTVNLTDYEEASGSITVDGAAVDESVSLTAAQIYTVTFFVTDGESGIEGATIDINGEQLTTDANGNATFDAQNGGYSFTVNADGYAEATGTVTVADTDMTKNVVMSTNGIEEFNASFKLYPNPSQGIFQVHSDQLYQSTVTVFDIVGKKIVDLIANDNTLQLDFTDQKKGIYFLRITSPENYKITRKLVIQ